MKLNSLLVLCGATLTIAAACSARLLAADEPVVMPVSANMPCKPCPHCQEEIVYHDVVTHRCKLVPDVKQIKKTVYECKEVPFCLPKLPPLFSHLHHDCCDCEPCVECDCPRYKKVLLKKEIVCKEICGSKCVIEEVIERVPCRVCKPCPYCAQAPANCIQATPPPVVTGTISDAPPAAGDVLLQRLPPIPAAE